MYLQEVALRLRSPKALILGTAAQCRPFKQLQARPATVPPDWLAAAPIAAQTFKNVCLLPPHVQDCSSNLEES